MKEKENRNQEHQTSTGGHIEILASPLCGDIKSSKNTKVFSRENLDVFGCNVSILQPISENGRHRELKR